MRNLTVGLLRSEISCEPSSLESFKECLLNPYVVGPLALHTFSQGHNLIFEFFDNFINSSSIVDDSTLMGNLISGSVDWIHSPLILNEDQAHYLRFTVPIMSDKFCFFVVQKQNWGYFTHPFSFPIWTIFALAISFCVVFKRFKQYTKSIPEFRKVVFYVTNVCFVLFYSIQLKVLFATQKEIKFPFSSVNELVQLVKTNNFKMVLSTSDEGLQMEMIKISKNSEVAELQVALVEQKAIKVVADAWKVIEISPNTFTLHTWLNFIYADSHAKQFCSNMLAPIFIGYGFPKGSKLLEKMNRRISFIHTAFMHETQRIELMHQFHLEAKSLVVEEKAPLKLRNMGAILGLYVASGLCCFLALMIEIAVSERIISPVAVNHKPNEIIES